MKERPILFSAPMVRAILEDRKTQTRRVVKPQPGEHCEPWSKDGLHKWLIAATGHAAGDWFRCPYGALGDRLWVRETWSKAKSCNCSDIFYRADGETSGKQTALSFIEREQRWRPSIHLPRWASRINLEVTGVRVERLRSITCGDIRREGGMYEFVTDNLKWWKDTWAAINGADSWAANPWVWVIEFKKVP